jgi:hypothetical protein
MQLKREARKSLDACTRDTLRRFCNRTTRFMDAHRKGLNIRVAAWCVKKQKRYRTISKEAVEAFDEYQKEGTNGR